MPKKKEKIFRVVLNSTVQASGDDQNAWYHVSVPNAKIHNGYVYVESFYITGAFLTASQGGVLIKCPQITQFNSYDEYFGANKGESQILAYIPPDTKYVHGTPALSYLSFNQLCSGYGIPLSNFSLDNIQLNIQLVDLAYAAITPANIDGYRLVLLFVDNDPPKLQ